MGDDDKKLLTDWEREIGVIATIAPDEAFTESITKEEFMAHEYDWGFKFVNYTDRIQFLQNNGYEVTRENMVDSSLSTKQPEA